LLHLRCIELNGDWERFFEWGYQRWLDHMRAGQRVMIRTDQADALPTAESMEARSYWIPGSYAPTLPENRNSFLRLLKNKGFKEERITKVWLYTIG
jgi:hypothetical protein